MTLELTFLALVIGVPFGLLIALARLSGFAPLKLVALVYVRTVHHCSVPYVKTLGAAAPMHGMTFCAGRRCMRDMPDLAGSVSHAPSMTVAWPCAGGLDRGAHR